MELRRKRAATPQKPSRLQPTEPLHMTTRAASKAASSNGGSSRRGSLYSNGQISPMTGFDNEGERYPKRRRVSTASKSTPTGATYASQSSSSRPSTRSMSGGNLHPIAESSPVTRRKRKRTSDVTAENISVAQPIKSRTEFERALISPTKKQPSRKAKRSSASSQEQETAEDDSGSGEEEAAEDDLDDTVESLQVPQSSADGSGEDARNHDTEGKMNGMANAHIEDASIQDANVSMDGDREASDQQQPQPTQPEEATERSGDTQAEEDDAQISMDIQNGDHAEQDEDNVQGESDVDEDMDVSRDELSLPKQLGIATLDPTPMVSATASPTGSNQDSTVDQESPTKQLTSVPLGEAPTASQDGDKPVKRLPGRRRAPHANPKVEAALRRQLHLRMAYRAVAKNLKPILAELSKRSLSNIHKDPESHTTFSEYPVVKESLNDHFEERLAWIQAQKDLNKQRLDQILREQTEMRKRNYEHVARDIKEDMIVRLQRDFLNTLRQQQQAEDDEYSDDEGDDVVPSLRRVTAKGALKGILGPEYHWRSRPALETERLFDEMYDRREVAHEHYQHDKRSALEDPRPFTTFDPIVRDAAEAQQKMKGLLAALGEAAEDVAKPPPVPIVEAPAAIPIIPNDEALGLLMLAEASTTANIMPDNISMAETEPQIDVPSRQDNLSVPRPSMSRAQSLATSAPTADTTTKPLEEPATEQRPPTTVPISFSQAVLEPSTTQTAPLFPRAAQPEQQEHRLQSGLPQLPQLPSIGQVVASQSQADTLSQTVAASVPLSTPTLSRPPPNDFWSSLAVGNVKTDSQGKAEFAPKPAMKQPSQQPPQQSVQPTAQQTSRSEMPVSSGVDNTKPEERSSRPSLPGASTTLEPLHQRLRSTSDSFGPLLDRPGDLDGPKPRKMPAPKKSLYGPWPRSRNYNPLDRRPSSTTTTAPQPSLPGINPRPSSGFNGSGPGPGPYSTSESRHTSYAPAPPPPMSGFPTASAAPYGPNPMYGAAPPPPYAYEQRGPYPPMAPYAPPSGFPGLPGAPMQQGQGPPPFYGSPHGLPPPPQQQGGYGPPAITSRPPPTPPAYGPQYGGQPILPASHDARYGPNGAPASNNAGPAFAQYQQHDGRRRRNQSLGHREFQHYHGPR
ncbi:hypothetical protein D6C82_03259 [Aureobasidium pullulans]|nr:hypothetical protein D6C82_03259 [Aureobasidium pullulans]